MPVALQESYVTQQFTIGLESTYGTKVAANKALKSIRAPFTPVYETEAFTPSGDQVPGVNVVNDAFTTVDATGRPDYNAMPYFVASTFGLPTISPVGVAAYEHLFLWNGRTPTSPASYTAIYGTEDRARECTGLIWTRYGMTVSRGGLDFTATGFAKEMEFGHKAYPRNEVVRFQIDSVTPPSGGTFTLTYGAQTTAAIPYNATASAVQTALEALTNIAPGEVLVTGSALPVGPLLIEFAGALGDADATAITATLTSLTGGSGHTADITVTQIGGPVVDVPPQVMFPLHFNVYLDTTWAGLGGSQLLYCYDFGIDLPERYMRTRPVNRDRTSDGVVESEDQAFTITMTLGVDATAESIINNIKTGTMVFVRLEAVGPEAGGANFPYLYRQDMALFLTSVDAFAAADGVHVIPITATLARDAVSGNATRVLVRNKLAAL